MLNLVAYTPQYNLPDPELIWDQQVQCHISHEVVNSLKSAMEMALYQWSLYLKNTPEI